MRIVDSIAEIDFSPGKVTYVDFNLTSNDQLVEHLDELKEDMLQVKYSNNIVVDVGWYPSGNLSGRFKLYVIQEFDWTNPIFSAESRGIKDIFWLLAHISEYVVKVCQSR